MAEPILSFQSIAARSPRTGPVIVDNQTYKTGHQTSDPSVLNPVFGDFAMRLTAFVSGLAFVPSVMLSSSVALSAPSVTLMPTSWLGEAASVAFAFALPALAAGAYLASRRLLQEVRDHPGLSLGAAGLITAGAMALFGFDIPGAARVFGIGG